jgi:hypothetical protein
MATTLTVHRGSTYADRLRAYHVILDGTKIGEIRDGETKSFPISAGQHELSMKIDWCGSRRIQFDAGESDAIVFNTKSNFDGPKILAVIFYAIFAPKHWVLLVRAS